MEFLIYKKFDKKEDALYFSDILKDNGIEVMLEDTGSSLDSSFGNSAFAIEYILKIQKDFFNKADQLFNEVSKSEIEAIDEDYYLFQYSNDELRDVIVKKDEWGDFNYNLALKILNDRGVEVSAGQIEDARKERLTELSKPEKDQGIWVVIGYFFALLGGLLGIFIGWHLLTFKKTLPNGEKVHNYSAKDRNHGKRIFILGIVSAVLMVVLKLLIYS
ncbi:hypothetical protein [Flavobacterium pedocola]